MKVQASTPSQTSSNPGQTLHAYYELTKPRVVALIVFTAIVGMFLSVEGMVPVSVLIFGKYNLKILLTSSCKVFPYRHYDCHYLEIS